MTAVTTRKTFVIALLATLLLAACDKIPPEPTIDTRSTPVRMVVVNEGLFTTNTAALSVVYTDGRVDYDVFRAINRRPLGDVAQSLTLIHGLYFVAVNNSRRIEVLDPRTFRSVGSIRFRRTASPRYITPLTDSTALVSDLYNQLVTIRTRPPYHELEYIELPFSSSGIEQMVTVGDKVFGIYAGHGVAVFDAKKFELRTMRLIDDAVVDWSQSTARPIVDRRQRLWVLTGSEEAAHLHCIDTESEEQVEDVEIPFAATDIRRGDIIGMPGFNRTDSDPSGRYLYLSLFEATKDHPARKDPKLQVIYRLDTETLALERYLPLPGVRLMYGMNISPTGEVCVCDCLDYTAQRGYIRVYSPDRPEGETESFKVAVYPNFVYFPHNE